MVGAQEKKNVILYAQNEFKISERRSCKLFVAPRSSIRYQAVPNDDEEVKAKIISIAQNRPRFGSPRIHQMLLRKVES